MGKKDTITKDYMSEPKHFADAFNYYLFDGEQVIKPEYLQVLDPTEMGIILENDSKKTIQKIRDVLKQCVIMENRWI